MKNVILSILLVFSVASMATEDQVSFETKQQEALYKELLKELRCPKCQNQNIADSNAVVAKDMRAKTKELVDQGQDKKQVIDYMVNRYGQFAHYQPPLNIATSMLWLLPLAFVMLAGGMLYKRSRNSSESESKVTVTKSKLNDELDRELEQLMTQEEKNK